MGRFEFGVLLDVNVNLQRTDPIFEGNERSEAPPTPPTKASMSSAKVVQVARNFLCACGARQGLDINRSIWISPCHDTLRYLFRVNKLMILIIINESFFLRKHR